VIIEMFLPTAINFCLKAVDCDHLLFHDSSDQHCTYSIEKQFKVTIVDSICVVIATFNEILPICLWVDSVHLFARRASTVEQAVH